MQPVHGLAEIGGHGQRQHILGVGDGAQDGPLVVATGTGADPEEAGELLRPARWNVKAAIVMKKAGLTYPQALRRLRSEQHHLRFYL